MSAVTTERLQPATAAAAADALRAAAADGASLLPCGNLSRFGRHAPGARPDRWLSLARMDRILRVDPGDHTCEVETGVSPAVLEAALAEHGLELGVSAPGPERGTLGGLFLSPDVSLLHAAYGPPRDQVLGATWLLADGSAVRTGARVVKSVAGYDVTRLFLGSRGRLAACTGLILRLRPRPAAPRWYRVEPDKLKDWLTRPPGSRPPLRMAFSAGDPRDLAWVQTDGVRLSERFHLTEEDEPEGRAAVERALSLFRQATHRLVLPSVRGSHRIWRQYASDADAYDWLAGVGSFTPRTEREESALRTQPGVRVLPHGAPSPWVAAVAQACAPGAPRFGERSA